MARHSTTQQPRKVFPLLTEGKLGKSSREPGLAVDTFGFAIRVDRDYETVGATATVRSLGQPGEAWRYSRTLPGGGFLGYGVGDRAWLEASLPKRIDGENVEGVPFEAIRPLCEDMVREAGAAVRPVEALDEAKVVRVDLVRDFEDVRHVGALLDGLAAVHRPARHKTRRFADAASNQAETLRVGPKAWAATLYDKHAETQGRAPAGRLRCEIRLHADQLTSVWARDNGGHVRQVADLAEGKLLWLRRSMFERVAFDREVSAVASIAAAVWNVDGLSSRERAALWAYLTMPGYAAQVDPKTERKYRDYARSIGVVPGTLSDAEALASVRLDYQTGREVVRVA